MNDSPIHGHCDDRFAPVRDAFTANFERHDELGAGFAVMVDGEMVVDLWGGWVDADMTRPWQRETLACVHSVTKGLFTFAVHCLAARGALDFDARVADYWPEFAAAGKQDVTVRMLLSHQAGLPVVDGPLAPGIGYDWTAMCRVLEAQRPIWPPGTRHGYHAATWGYLAGELARRASGLAPGALLHETVTGPWSLDFHLGLPAEHDARVAEFVSSTSGDDGLLARLRSSEQTLTERAFGLLPPDPTLTPRQIRANDAPSGNGYGNARSIAQAFGGFARGGALGGVRLLDPARAALLYAPQVGGRDEVLQLPITYGLGLWVQSPDSAAMYRGEHVAYHPGVGGQQGLADFDRRLSYGYAMNRLGAGPRRNRIERALHQVVKDVL